MFRIINFKNTTLISEATNKIAPVQFIHCQECEMLHEVCVCICMVFIFFLAFLNLCAYKQETGPFEDLSRASA
jgi:hypothetical protein